MRRSAQVTAMSQVIQRYMGYPPATATVCAEALINQLELAGYKIVPVIQSEAS